MRGILFNHLIVSIIGLGFLTSCIDYQGQLVINRTLKVKEKKSTKIIPEGVYSAQLSIKSKKKLKISVNNNTFKESATIKIEKGYQLPSSDGDFKIPAAAMGQNFDIKGYKQTSVSRSPSRSEEQYCSISRSRTTCQKVCEIQTIQLPDGKIKKERVCKDVCKTITRNLPGHKLVISHLKTVSEQLDLSLIHATSLAPLADYSGGNSVTSTIYEHIGACRLERR